MFKRFMVGEVIYTPFDIEYSIPAFPDNIIKISGGTKCMVRMDGRFQVLEGEEEGNIFNISLCFGKEHEYWEVDYGSIDFDSLSALMVRSLSLTPPLCDCNLQEEDYEELKCGIDAVLRDVLTFRVN